MKEYLIYSKFCFIEGSFKEATLHIEDGQIASIYSGLNEINGLRLLNYSEFIVMPGIIDPHVHINEPGRTSWEGFDTATKAAALGGITTLIEMPLNSDPVTTTVEAFDIKKEAAQNKLHVNCGFYGGLIPSNLSEVEALLRSGVFGLKGFFTHSGIDEFPNITKAHLEAVAPILKHTNLPLLLHCELDDHQVPDVNDPRSYSAYLNSRPKHWETLAIELAMEIQATYNIKVHIVHLSAASALEGIKRHKQSSTGLSVETCPHYLFFNAESIPDGSPIYKCAPPIREKQNNDQLWKALENGEFDFIGSDHSPAPPVIKQLESGDFFKAWGGISGLQFSLAVLNTLAKKNDFPIDKLLPLMTSRPAQFLGIEHKKGLLKQGYDADITVWDAQQSIAINEDMIAHRHKATPYLGRTLFGKVIHTFVNGHQIVENSEFIKRSKGTLLLKK
ncbi:MAG: allantoinase AllB [Flavobacteriaceae bacterium]|nr:allantoinase AllB [Flavobacteriaceae bacterium]